MISCTMILANGSKKSGGFVCAFSTRARDYRRRSFSLFQASSSTKSGVTSTSTTNDDDNSSPGFILPSHPDLKIRTVMAPMVAASDYPFRYFLQKHCGVDLTYTQMLHSKNFCNDPTFRKTHLDLYEAGAIYDGSLLPSQLECLGEGSPVPVGPPQENNARAPLMVQLAGHNVDLVVKTALMIMDHTGGGVAGFDLNCGCPQGIAKKGRYGAFLMEENDRLVCEILSALRSALPPSTAVSAKIRLPLDDDSLEDRIPRLVGTGINFMTIHGRTLLENKTKVGAVHTDRIRLAIDAAHRVDPTFPVVANGGMETYRDIQEIVQSTGAVAAMSSEALLEIPNIMTPESLDLTPRERMEQQFSFARDYLNICATIAPPLPGVLGTGGSFGVVRGHLFKFLHRYLQEYPDLRERMAFERRENTIPQVRVLIDELYGRYANLSEQDWDTLQSSSKDASWYRRRRKGSQYVHQKEVRLFSALQPAKEEETANERKQRMKERIERLRQQNKENAESDVKRFIS
jgi:tRNA-dihydrouridine synthase 1